MRIKGGLGNQLFQYASAYALAKRLNQKLAFDPSFTANMTVRGYKLPLLCVESDEVIYEEQLPKKVSFLKNLYINKLCRVLNIARHNCGKYIYWLETKDEWQPDFFTINGENLYVDGYFQSENYFKQYKAELFKQIQPKYDPEDEYLSVLEKIRSCNSVAVHVRRSDFKKDNCAYHYLLDESYYRNAIQKMRDTTENPVFFWFSDDLEWVKEHMGEADDFQIVKIHTPHGDFDDMMLMKNCHHIIAANSTFSWWAAWLNEHDDAIRIVPKKPYGMEGMIPNGWIKVAVNKNESDTDCR